MTPRVVWCPECTRDRRRQRSKIGEVVELPYPLAPHLGPRLLWHGFNPASARKMRNFTDDGVSDPPVLRHVWVTLVDPGRPDLVVPERLEVWCDRHGPLTVSTDDVIDRRM